MYIKLIKNVNIIFFLVFISIIMCACSSNKGDLSENISTNVDMELCDELNTLIDKGDEIGFAEKLLSGEINLQTFEHLQKNGTDIVDRILADALVNYGKSGNVEKIFKLRNNKFSSNQCMQYYWELIGSEIPTDVLNENDVDSYLLHEMFMAFKRDEYSICEFQELRENKLINDKMHKALIAKLGFDYTDNNYLDSNQIAPLRKFSIEERNTYYQIINLIDNGESIAICQKMLNGEISKELYLYLMNEDKESMDLLITHSLLKYRDEGLFENIIKLRKDEFVSDDALSNYWKSIGVVAQNIDENDTETEDLLLQYELNRILLEEKSGEDIIFKLKNKGLID